MSKEIIVIEYGVDEETGASFEMVAATKRPAVKEKGYAFSEQEKEAMRSKFFADDEKMQIIAPVIIPNVDMSPRYDWVDIGNGPEYLLHKPIFTAEGITKMYKVFMDKLKTSHIFNNEHETEELIQARPAYMFEVWQKESMEQDKSALYGLDQPVGTLYMKEQITDKKYWEEVKKTGTTGFSIQGMLGTKKYNFSDEVKDIINSLTPKQLERLLNELL